MYLLIKSKLQEFLSQPIYQDYLIEIKYTSTASTMLIINRLIKIAKPFVISSSLYSKQTTLLYTNRMWFSQQSAEKIIKMIEKGNIQKNLDKIMTEVAPLSEDLKEEVLEVLIENIYSQNLQPRVVLNQKLANQLKSYPHLHFQAYYFRIVSGIEKLEELIDDQDNKLKMVIAKEISDAFVLCFQNLKKMEPKVAAPKQIQLLQSFASYNFYSLSKLVDPKKKQECINKSRQCYKLTLVKSTALLKSLLKEEKQLISNANPHQTLQQEEKRENELLQLDQLKFQIIQQYAQIVTEMLDIEDQLFQQKQEEKQLKEQNENQQQIDFEMGKQSLWLQPALLKALQNYQKIPHRMMQSKYYYKLTKIHLQVKKQIKLRELDSSTKTKQQKKQQLLKIYQSTKQEMNHLYKNILQEMRKIETQELDAEVFADNIMVMLSTKPDQFLKEEGQDIQMNAKKIGEQVQKLANYIADQNKKMKTLGLVIQKVKDAFDIKIDSYIQKVPRSLRTQRRRRFQEEELI